MDTRQRADVCGKPNTTAVLGLALICMFSPMPSMAKTPACSETVQEQYISYWNLSPVASDCTYAQLSAWTFRRSANNDDKWLLDDDASVVNAYVAYLSRVYEGYMPADRVLQDAEKAFKDAYTESGMYAKYVEYLEDPENGEFSSTDPFDYLLVWCEAPMLIGGQGARNAGRDWVREEFAACEETNDTCVYGAAQRLLGAGNSTTDSLYLDDGFRMTGIDTDVTSFGVWAQDSYWGFWQSKEYKGKRALWELEGFGDSTAYVSIPMRHTLFIAGGRNPTKPTTGTWEGLAVGQHKLLNVVRVGHSEIVVNLDASKVDITITGLNFGGSRFSVNDDEFDVAPQLTWTGLDLSNGGSFHDPRTFGVQDDLDDAFAAVLPDSGENYSDTASTIRGQFYGENGHEVTGVFDKNHVEGSFGAYRQD